MRTLLLLTLALASCVTPKVLGGTPEADTGKDTDTDTDTDATTSGTTTFDVTLSGATTSGATTSDFSTTADTADTGPKFDMMAPMPGDCEAASLDECEANPACMTVFGEPEEFEGCTPGPQYLGCLPQLPCDTALLTVCDDETNEPFRLSNGCFPPGFSPCEGTGVPCGGADTCEGLDEQGCASAGCTSIFGAPHVVQDDIMCADYDALEFLGCLPADTACPPSVPVLCPAGQDEPAWDVPSGCLLPGFDLCDEQLVPACG
jgi:hypothetical protein